MLLLTGTTDQLFVITLVGSADVEVHASYVDNDAGTLTPGRTNTASITTATTTEVVAAVGASKQRAIGFLSVRNNHASQTELVAIIHSDGTNIFIVLLAVLLAGEVVTLDANGRWIRYTVEGQRYVATGTYASQATMEAGTSVTAPVSPGMQHHHPGHPKCWLKCGVTGNLLDSYNIASVADTGTGVATVSISTDFATANWVAEITVERASTSLAVANARIAPIQSGGQAAGSLVMECHDLTGGGTVSIADPTSWHMVGLGDHA